MVSTSKNDYKVEGDVKIPHCSVQVNEWSPYFWLIIELLQHAEENCTIIIECGTVSDQLCYFQYFPCLWKIESLCQN
jgi:hypothetical protein